MRRDPIPGLRRSPRIRLLPFVLACAVPAPLVSQEKSHAAAGPGGHGDPILAAEPGRIQVGHEQAARNIVALLGPFDLPADGHSMRLTAAEVITIPVDGWLTSFRARILDADGGPMAPETLHHINVVRPDRRELFFPVMQRVAAAGRETGRISTPFPFGVPVAAGDTLLVSVMLHNPTGAPVRIMVEARFHYDTPAWLNRLAVEPFHMDIRPPPYGASFDLPPGRSELTWEGSPAVDVAILAMGGHMHELGRELRLEVLAADGAARVLWRTAPELDEDGRVASIPRTTFLLRLGLPLSADRRYRIVAVYDNPTGRTIPAGGMAEIAGLVRPKGAWPAADHQDPWFHADYAHFTRHNPALERAGPGEEADGPEHAHGHDHP